MVLTISLIISHVIVTTTQGKKCFYCFLYCRIYEHKAQRTLELVNTVRKRAKMPLYTVNLRRINLEGNTHVQESNVSQLPV
jgi:hypothetical protein